MQGSHEGAQSEHQYHTTRFQYCTGEHNYKTEKGSEYLSLQNVAQKLVLLDDNDHSDY